MKKLLILGMFANVLCAMDVPITPLPTEEDFKIAKQLYLEYEGHINFAHAHNEQSIFNGITPCHDIKKLQNWIGLEIMARFKDDSAKQIAIARAYFLSPFGQNILPGENKPRSITLETEYSVTLEELASFNKIKIIADRYGRALIINNAPITNIDDLEIIIPELRTKDRSTYKAAYFTSISIEGAKLQSLDLAAFKSFNNLKHLSCCGNLTTNLTPTSDTFDKLESIDLSNNLLTYIDPCFFDGFKVLEWVSLQGNPLTAENKLQLIAKFKEKGIMSDIMVDELH